MRYHLKKMLMGAVSTAKTHLPDVSAQTANAENAFIIQKLLKETVTVTCPFFGDKEDFQESVFNAEQK